MGLFSRGPSETINLLEPGPGFEPHPDWRKDIADVGDHFVAWLATRPEMPRDGMPLIRAEVDSMRTPQGWLSHKELDHRHPFETKTKHQDVYHYLTNMAALSRIGFAVWASWDLKGQTQKQVSANAERMWTEHDLGSAVAWTVNVRPDARMNTGMLNDSIKRSCYDAVEILNTNRYSQKDFRRSIENWANRQ